ncbi:methionine adenosyltransferase [Rhodospirillum rubrum]|uniref:methionine adenosyltransferase n=1 Tax=Rhodospirillum rubrum TaxID=1085 RepID=UPI0019084B3B|nr:methionine adenosyltransferase [Rhodospirillum rubrum]MBK1664601.1 methionine adenosyltransferase [Rhodospirillum rubrum]MBK1677690.1 methionine adenosyltransferase [Rhodospirillum rubrum]
MRAYCVTSESVTEGHPDKVCDQISDGILDACLAQDPAARVAVETLVSGNTVFIAGEITTTARLDAVRTAREVIRDIGYADPALGFDSGSCFILTNLRTQSPDIDLGVSRGAELGAGDQGVLYGYACDETASLMPAPIHMAHGLSLRLAAARHGGVLPWLRPDGKTQVTVRYDGEGRPEALTSVIVSTQHDEGVNRETLARGIIEEVIYPEVGGWLKPETRVLINPTGRFVIGGPAGDTGVTGRKLMVDTYGGCARHGGGAFSGKDSTKVDRTAAYMARYAAKNVVAAGLARRCEVALAYAIGERLPEMVSVETFGTETIDVDRLTAAVRETFPFSVSGMIAALDLRRPIFRKTAAYGHFGRENQGFQWEKTDRVDVLRAVCGL